MFLHTFYKKKKIQKKEISTICSLFTTHRINKSKKVRVITTNYITEFSTFKSKI